MPEPHRVRILAGGLIAIAAMSACSGDDETPDGRASGVVLLRESIDEQPRDLESVNVDTQEATHLASLPMDVQPRDIGVDPSGRRVVYATSDDRLLMLDLANDELIEVDFSVLGVERVGHPSFSPDGTRLAVGSSDGLYHASLDDDGSLSDIEGPAYGDYAAFLDNEKLLYMRMLDGQADDCVPFGIAAWYPSSAGIDFLSPERVTPTPACSVLYPEAGGGEWVAVASPDQSIVTANGERILQVNGVTTLAVSPRGDQLAVRDFSKEPIRIVDFSGNELSTLEADGDIVAWVG